MKRITLLALTMLLVLTSLSVISAPKVRPEAVTVEFTARTVDSVMSIAVPRGECAGTDCGVVRSICYDIAENMTALCCALGNDCKLCAAQAQAQYNVCVIQTSDGQCLPLNE